MRKCLGILTFLLSMVAIGQSTIQGVAQNLAKHKYNKIYKSFDANMKEKVPKSELKKLWEQLESTVGPLQNTADVSTVTKDEGITQRALLQFEKGAVQMSLSVNGKGKINGLYLSQLGYEPPKYGRDMGVGRRFINFESHTYNISGELMIPLVCNECPVVVLVHGSGPNDKDETIGPNKVFYDLALGFASKGIATYRYDKRSKLYPEAFAGQFDLYDETINDAISAVYTLKSDTSLHFGKYILLGHSLGAYAMPLMADSLKDAIDGAILFSANARRLEDLIEYQMKYLTEYDGGIDKNEAKIIAENTQRAADIRENKYTTETSAENLLAYWPGTFWKGIAEYDPVITLSQNHKTPFYIVQGEKDYQITMTDYAMWQHAVGAMENVRMQSYPHLTHLFTPTVNTKSSPADYFLPNNVEFQVIWDLSDWIKLGIR